MAKQVDTHSENIINCDFTDVQHCTRLCEMVNAYIADPKGGGTQLTDRQKLYLLDGLESNENAIVLMALHKEDIIGYTVAFLNFSTFKAAPCINIHDLYLDEAYRHQGKGKEMLQKIIEIATEEGCKKATLEVRKDNETAQLLYFSEGFSPTTPEMFFWTKEL